MAKIETISTAQLNAWIDDLNKEFKGQSDRGLAIVAGSLLDEILSMLLRAFLVRDVQNSDDELFGSQGAFATFSAKIKVAFALGLISSDERRELDTIRRIRNDFAHQLGALSFDDPSVRDRCGALVLPERLYVPERIPLRKSANEPLPVLDLTFPEGVSSRERFRMSVVHTMHVLSVRLGGATSNRRKCPDEFESPEDTFRFFLDHSDAMMGLISDLEQRLGESEPPSQAVVRTRQLTRYIIEILERSRRK